LETGTIRYATVAPCEVAPELPSNLGEFVVNEKRIQCYDRPKT
jgi:hypothetical protein